VPSAPAPKGFSVVVVSGDGTFRRLAGAALSRAGHDVHTMTARPGRVRRMIELRSPDVLVIEEGEQFTAGISEHVASLADGPGVVIVSEKFGPVDGLISDVERAAQQRGPGGGRRHLRLVSDEPGSGSGRGA